MKALLFDETLQLRDIPLPVPAPGEALVRVRVAGVCNTDLEIIRGYMGFKGVLGHEFVGEVVRGSGRIGRRVVGEINCPCGECPACRRGLRRHCPTRGVVGIFNRQGAFAEYIALPEANLHDIPKSLDDRAAVFVEPVAACFEILEQVDIRRDSRVAVIGDGKLGILATQVLKTKSRSVTLFGKHENKLLIACDEFGINAVHTKHAPSQPEFDIVVECSGNPTGLDTATRIVRPRGVIVLKSTYSKPPTLNPAPWVINEITIIGSRCGPFEPAIAALKKGTVRVLPLIESEFPLAKAKTAFKRAAKRGAMKVLLNMRHF